MYIRSVEVIDKRFDLPDGAGSDATHNTPQYAYAVCHLKTDTTVTGVGLAFTLGAGTDLVCKAIKYLSVSLKGKEIEHLMLEFGTVYRSMADSPSLRWLGPQKGVVHLALAAIVNACLICGPSPGKYHFGNYYWTCHPKPWSIHSI
jgi:L-fuconate dehydratase